jgi:cell division protein FtsW (lipid II flippase)
MGGLWHMCKQARPFLLVSIIFVVAISKIPSQVVEEVTTLVMMMMMMMVVVVMMLMMMYITIPSSHFPLENCQKCAVHIQIWFPVQAQNFIPKSYTQVSVFFFLAKLFSPVRLAIFIFTFANWQ